MKTFLYNMGYFIQEANRIIRFHSLSNLFSVIGTALILFLLGIVIAGWSIGDTLIDALKDEAEISAYVTADTDQEMVAALAEEVKSISGVIQVIYIAEEEARVQMEELLGEEAEVLSLFDENPFEDYLEVRINLDHMDDVLDEIRKIQGIEYVRDNREVLEQMRDITEGIKVFGSLVIIAVGITTLILISHMIRQGIYNNKEQLNTLRLLGAPNSFIGLPFVLAGILMTFLGGILAITGLWFLLTEGYHEFSGILPFIPLPSQEELVYKVCIYVIIISVTLGFAGSLFGLSSIKKEK